MVALGTTAPVLSATTPSTVPVVAVWAILAVTKNIETNANTASVNNLKFVFIFNMSFFQKVMQIVCLRESTDTFTSGTFNANAMPMGKSTVNYLNKGVRWLGGSGKWSRFPNL